MPKSPDRDLVARCHANAIEDYRTFARATEGGWIEEESGLVLIAVGGHESLDNPAFVTEPPRDPDATVRRIRSFFSAHAVPSIVITLPTASKSMRPALRSAAYYNEGAFPGMLLSRIRPSPPARPPNYRVERVRSLESLRALQRTGSRAYGVPYAEPDPRWLSTPGLRTYLGYDGDEPVSLGALIPAFGIAGIAYVGTVPDHRGRGYAEALVWQALCDSREDGCTVGYLWATPMGRGVYERMGFRTILDYQIWSAPGSRLPRAIQRPSGLR